MPVALEARVISGVYDAILDADHWPSALQALSEFFGAGGAAYLLRNKRRNLVDSAFIVGPLAMRAAEYVDYYSKVDPYLNLLLATPEATWRRLSLSLPQPELRRSEWYTDFVLKSGVDDLTAVCLHDGPTHSIAFGYHQTRHTRFRRHPEHLLREVREQLCRAARIHYQLRSLGWKSMMTMHALDRLSVGVILVDSDSRVMDATQAADRILSAGDGLFVQNARLRARRAFETSKLDQLVAAAAREDRSPAAGRMVVAGRDGRASCIVTVVPVDERLTPPGRSAAMIILVDSESQSPSGAVMAEIFGLSPAETRLARALMKGMPLDAVASENGVRITTLRTQLGSILRKVGVKRQADLVRVLSGLHVIE